MKNKQGLRIILELVAGMVFSVILCCILIYLGYSTFYKDNFNEFKRNLLVWLKNKEDAKQIQKNLNMLSTALREEKNKTVEVVKKIKTKVNFKVGDRVFVKSINQFANILKINTSKESASVQAGILKLEVPFEEIKIVEEKKEKVYNVSTHKKTPVRSEIDLRGKMVDEGIYELETYLDRATLNGYTEVYVIHGKGTGALREGILKYLKTSKYVKEYRIGGHGEGGLGCTVVTLK